jgi:hypothetical protein
MDDSKIFTLTMFAITGLPILIIPLVLIMVGRAVQRRGGRQPGPAARFGCAMLLVVPVCAFCGIMVAAVGGALHPPVITVAAPYVCDGMIETQSQDYSYRPGQQGTAHNVFCSEADGNRRDITLRTFGAASLYYTLIILAAAVVLGGLLRLLKPRRAAPAQPRADLAQYLADRLRVDADILRRTGTRQDSDSESAEQRLRHLQSLRDGGLISESEYQAKRAEILAGL